MTARVVLYTRVGCHLCSAAEQVIRRVLVETGRDPAEDLETRDVDERADWLDEHSEWVPVTVVDGRQLDYWRVDESRLRAALAAGSPSGL